MRNEKKLLQTLKISHTKQILFHEHELTILVESTDVYLYCISVIIRTSFDQLDQPPAAILLLFISAAIGYFP